MSTAARGVWAFGLVAFGWFLGAGGTLQPARLDAQAQPADAGLSEDASQKVKAAIDAAAAAAATLQAEQRHAPITTGTNAFAVLSGGVNAMEDLASDRGVDPETFAALYADLAIDEVKAKLAKDENGRLTYEGKVVKLYPISRLKKMFAEREKLLTSKGAKPAATN